MTSFVYSRIRVYKDNVLVFDGTIDEANDYMDNNPYRYYVTKSYAPVTVKWDNNINAWV